MRTSPFIVDYAKLFRAANHARSFVNKGELEEAIARSAANGDGRYPYFDRLIAEVNASTEISSFERSRGLICMAGAEILLRVKSAPIQPKYSNTPSYAHPLEAREILEGCAEEIVSLPERIEGAILAPIHDNMEDFGTTADQISRRFGRRTAANINIMTTKKPPVLALRYPEILDQHLLSDAVKGIRAHEIDAAEYLSSLEKGAPNGYARLKRDLKLASKLDEFPILNFIGVGTRDADDIAVLRRYNRDIEQGYVAIDPYLALGEKRKSIGGQNFISAELILANIEDRTICHQAAMNRINGLRDDARTNVQPNDNRAFAQRLTAEFTEARAALLEHLERALLKGNSKLRSGVTAAREWTSPPALKAA